ncbi:MAG: OmpA family protein [Bacteroidales bacterium]|jgi:chemotaxis protein MotB|nr:OmpA family protein [Bacteroidales bacterium]
MNKSLIIMAVASLTLMYGCVPQKKYADMENRYKKVSNALEDCLDKSRAFNDDNTKLQGEIAALGEKMSILQADSRKVREENKNLKSNNEELKLQIADANKRLSDAIASKGNDLKQINDELNATRENLNKRQEEIDVQNNELKRMQDAFKEKEYAMQRLQRNLNEKEEQLASLEKKISQALLGFMDKGLSIEKRDNKVYVSLEEKLLFPSGSWDISPDGASALREIAKVLEKNPDIDVMVEGHTDNVPLKGRNQVKDNWDLSVMRATSVTKILLQDKNISPERIIPSGRGEYMPITDNKTSESRAKNRRTEIILSPKVDELMKIIDK